MGTSKKRAESEVKTDDDFVQKHAEQARRREELQEREREYRTGKGNEKNNAILNTQGKAQTILKDKAETQTEARDLKDATTMKNLTNQFEYWGEKADSPVYKEQARVKLERKAMLDDEVRAKAEKEIKTKEMRNNVAQSMKQQP